MCGICGVFNYKSKSEISEELIVSMRDSMIHRGPDDADIYISNDIGLGHRRLSIIDLNPRSKQPMCNEDESIWIVFNGEIYNYKYLREELRKRGHILKTESDTETIIHLYEEKGIDCIHDLEGMFAFGLWDENKKRLFLVRDRIGIKPLYYTINDGQLIFASEIKAILKHPDIKREVDEEALYHYLTFLVAPAPKTLFKGIYKLPPGYYLYCDDKGNLETHQYWDIVFSSQEIKTEKYYCENILKLLEDSVRKRMQSDVPFGLFLSGGIDSSTICALMNKMMDRPVETFSVGFKEMDPYNEFVYAKQIAELFETNHHEVIIDHNDLMRYLPKLIHTQDEPIADPVCFPLYYVSDLLRKHDTIVVLVGEGSDEQFSGYDNYMRYFRMYNLWKILKNIPNFVKEPMYSLFKGISRYTNSGRGMIDKVNHVMFDEELFWGGAIAFWENEKREVISREMLEKLNNISSYEIVKSNLSKIEGKNIDYLNKMIYLEFKNRLPELLLMRVDKITMSTSNEARVPFLDHRLVEFTMNIPAKLKVKNGVPKYILKKVVEGMIPHEIIYRKKVGFWAPI
ncbi:MAG: asparagine synthase (glutamine-hydrolyzing), partial [Methanosarcinales archaeon]